MRHKPKYALLKDKLIDQIRSGYYVPGQQIPSQNVLIEKEGVSYSTVIRTLEELKKDGYIYRVNGRGTFVAGDWQRKTDDHTGFIVKVAIPQADQYVGFNTYSPNHVEILRGCLEACSELDAKLETIYYDEENEFVIDKNDENCGYFFFNYWRKLDIIRELDAAGIPSLCHAPMNVLDKSVSAVTVNVFEGARAATDMLLESGKNKIAFLASEYPADPWASPKQRGFVQAHADRGVDHDPALILKTRNRRNECLKAVTEFLRSGDGKRMDAIFAVNDLKALAALDALNELKRSVPDDVAVVGFDNIAQVKNANPPLSTVEFPHLEVGRQAVRLLLHLKRHPELRPFVKVLNTRFVSRQSFVP